VGKERETGLGLLCGMTTSFFSRVSAAVSWFFVSADGTRLLIGSNLVLVAMLWRMLLVRPSKVDGRGRLVVGALPAAPAVSA